MATKKNTPQQQPGAPPADYSKLAGHIAAILADPLTPVALYNAIADEVASMSEAINIDAPEAIERILVAYQTREERRAEQ
jgi:hypothetical protein